MLSLIATRGCRGATRLLRSAPRPHPLCLSAASVPARPAPKHFSSSSQSADDGTDVGAGASSAGESSAAATRRARAPKRSFASNLQPIPIGGNGASGGSSGGGTFVSAHFEVPNFDIITYLKRRHLSYTENEAHFIVRLCPFCHPQRDSTDHFKLYILKSRGVFHCHRCQAQGSWFDFKKRLGDLKEGASSSLYSSSGQQVSAGDSYSATSSAVQPSVTSSAPNSAVQPFYALRSFSAVSPALPGNGNSSNAPSSFAAAAASSVMSGSGNVGCLGGGSGGGGSGGGGGGSSAGGKQLDSASMRELVANLNAWPAAKQFLLETRGLSQEVIELYGLGATLMKFPDDSGKFTDQICITFPWIRSIEQPAIASPSSSSSSSRRPRKTPAAAATKITTDAAPAQPVASEAVTLSEPSSAAAPAAGTAVSASVSAASAVPPTAGPYEPHHCDAFVTDRYKARSIVRKNGQRLVPTGGGWGWFGWHTVPADATTIVVTEGEFDAMAVHQATGLPAISLPNGCSSLPPQLLPRLERFKKIILWMDDDAPGQAGAENFTQKLGVGRCHIVRSRQGRADGPKDANDALRSGANLFDIIQSATPMPHSQIATFEELRQDVYRELLEPGKISGTPSQSLPTLTKLMKGHRRGELTVLTGPTGTGKTTFLSQLSLDWCRQGVRTLWGSFEIKNARLAKTLMTQFAQKSLEGNLEEYELWADRFTQLPLFFLRFYGSSEVEQIVDAMEYAVYVHDVEHVILDNLQFMLSGQGRGIEKFDAQEHAIEIFRSFATRKNVHVTLVIHPRKEAEGAALGVSSIFGTAKATQEADNVLILQDGGSCRIIEVKKNRFDGDLGSVYMRFDKASKTFFELSEAESASMEQSRQQNAYGQAAGRRYAASSASSRKKA